jgi:hypothetical protein
LIYGYKFKEADRFQRAVRPSRQGVVFPEYLCQATIGITPSQLRMLNGIPAFTSKYEDPSTIHELAAILGVSHTQAFMSKSANS